MPVSINNTQVVFNDATTQTTSGVTSIGTGTGISSTGGKTPTLTNTGVTSVTAGTGISVSASTGGVTISASGGVTSLNGQTGAITNTSLDTIGSVICAVHAVTIPPTAEPAPFSLNTNDTVAGSALRYNFSTPQTARYNQLSSYTAFPHTNAAVVGGYVNIAYNQGGGALSGTWRCMGRGTAYLGYEECGGTSARWYSSLFVRVS